jgi:cob(I)alamin adenosyltransferase
MAVFTKTGDDGSTSLYGGERVGKNSKIIEVLGSIDELNAIIGILEFELSNEKLGNLSDKVRRIKEELFVIGSDVATPMIANPALKIHRIDDSPIKILEDEIIAWEEEVPKLQHFVLPDGSRAALIAYQARAVCRRAERVMVSAQNENEMNKNVAIYLNRLSDWLFTLFRLINHSKGFAEHYWLSK